MKAWIALMGMIVTLATAPVASANSVVFAGVGTWGSNAPTTTYSQAGYTWQFSFQLPNPIASNPTTQATNFSYLLNDVVVPGTPTSIEFFPFLSGGLFNFNYPGNNIVSFYGVDVGSTLTLIPGSFTTNTSINNGPNEGTGMLTQTAVPEPSSIVLLGTAICLGLLGLVYFRRTTPKTAHSFATAAN